MPASMVRLRLIFTLAGMLLFQLGMVCGHAAVRGQTVFLHIGPCKTGTTYIQTFLSSMIPELKRNKICWPGMPKPSAFHAYVALIDRGDPVPELTRAIDACLAQGHDAIITSEDFGKVKNFSNVARTFAPYKVHVIAYHRELLSARYSSHTQGAKITSNGPPMADVILQFIDGFDMNSNAVSQNSNLRKYRAAFAKMTIVDYDGAMRAGKDIAEIIVYDIMKMPGSGAKVEILKEINHTPEMIPFDVLAVVRQFVRTLGCDFVRADDKLWVQAVAKRYAGADPSLFPVATHHLRNLRAMSDTESRLYRGEFGDIMLFNNHSAAMEVRDEFQFHCLNTHAFLSLRKSTTWVRQEVRRLNASNLLHCGGVGSLTRLY